MIYKCLKDCLVFMKVTFNWGRFAGGGGGCSGNSLDYEEQVND